jgi:hypothetical protein
MSRSFIVVGKWSHRDRKKRRREKEIAAQIHDSAYEDAHASALSVQVGVRLDPEVADRLRKTGRGLSDEIRERLDRTFKYDQVDPITRELVEGIINIAALLRLDFETEWHAWPPPFEAFMEAIKQRAAEYAPPLDIPGDPGAAMEMLREESPETIGRMRERDDRRAHAYKHLAEAQKRKSVSVGVYGKKSENK